MILEEEHLPGFMKKMSPEERNEYVENKRKERENYQKRINAIRTKSQRIHFRRKQRSG